MAHDCNKTPTHHQKVVSRENSCLTSRKQVRPNLPFSGEWHGFLICSNSVYSGSKWWISSLGSIDSTPVCCSQITPRAVACGNMNKVSLGFGCSQQSALPLLAPLGCDYMIEKNWVFTQWQVAIPHGAAVHSHATCPKSDQNSLNPISRSGHLCCLGYSAEESSGISLAYSYDVLWC